MLEIVWALRKISAYVSLYNAERERFHQPKRGPPIRLPPKKLPLIFVISACTLLWWIVLQYVLFPWSTSPYTGFWIFWVWLHIICFTIAYVMTIWCYYVTWKIQPSVPSPSWTPPLGAIDPLAPDQKIRYCDVCAAWQPPRTYHCKYCKRCILMQDQHCPWMNGCIGYGNLKPYILFLWNFFVLVGMAQFMTMWWLLMDLIGYEFETCFWQDEIVCWICTLVTAITLPLEILSLTLLIWQVRLTSFNVTNQEVAYWSGEVRRPNQTAQEVSQLRYWAYGRDNWITNMMFIFGTKWWLFPIIPEMEGDGTSFPLNPRWIESQKNKTEEEI